MRTHAKKLTLVSFLLLAALLGFGQAVHASSLYFPHVDTTRGWQTEIAIINTGTQSLTGTLWAYNNFGQVVETKTITISAHGRRQIDVAAEFSYHTSIGYIEFSADASAMQGYTKFYINGVYRVAVPAVRESDINVGDIYITHIDSSDWWWTGISLVNLGVTKTVTIMFNDGQIRQVTLGPGEHRAFAIRELFNNQPQPGIQSGVITNAAGIIGLELFGSLRGGDQLEGIPLTDNISTTLHYPYVAGTGWWTGIVAYNPWESSSTLTIRPYDSQGIALNPSYRTITGKQKYVGTVPDLGLPAQTAWFKIDSTRPLTGFELIGSNDFQQLAAYAGNGETGAKAGIFTKIEKYGWSTITLVNTEDSIASVNLLAYADNGTALAGRWITIGGHARMVSPTDGLFWEDVTNATYISFTSDKNLVGLQLNGSSDWKMFDGLPALAAGTSSTGSLKISNSTGSRIDYLYISPASSSTWGTERLQGDWLNNGYSITYVNVAVGSYDICAISSNSTEYYRWDVNVAGGSTANVIFSPAGSLRISNNTGFRIDNVYIAPSSSSSWGTDQLYGDALANGSSEVFTDLPPGTYDVKVVLSNTYAQYRYSINIAADSTVNIAFSPAGSLRVSNNTGFRIDHIYISSSSSTSWGTDQLGGGTLTNISSMTFNNMSPGFYDVKVVLSNGYAQYRYSVAVVAGTTVNVTFSASGSIRVTNNTGYRISYLYITPSTSSTWGSDWLGSGTLSNGSSLTFDNISPGSYDIKIILSDSTALYRYSVNVVAGSTTNVTFTYYSTSGSLRVINYTGFRIDQIYITPSSSSTWGTNQLAGSTLSNGSSLTFTDMSPGSYDVAVILSTSATLYRWGVIVVAGYRVDVTFS